ncbi:DsrE/DsrF/DrsH-like family protein [Aestuariivivens sp. NBU2969]|uniref:DsrE family protein n=1 Tax=Aestuariivivens sp. NBU2969 TaxID=2873267 RepID=UPI001CBC2A7A|nr:DsrE/DsrF/DrsH-like family protein [Aestuariivivens sp. NBU2969]
MQKILLSLAFIFSLFNVSAQEPSSKIIIDVTSTNFKVYQSVLLTLKIMTKSHPNTHFDIIAYGEAVPMMMKNQSVVADEILKYIENQNINFTACEVSMSLFNIKREQLLEGVKTVANAVDDIVKKQNEGWGYIKSGN